MAVRIIREEAPELSGAQVEELTKTWIPEKNRASSGAEKPPDDLMRSMIEQFAAFSRRTLNKEIEKSLRDELGPWPERYWRAFPPGYPPYHY